MPCRRLGSSVRGNRDCMRKGFTFIELLVTTTIIGLISVTVTVGVQEAMRYARDIKRIADVGTIRTGLELFYDTNLFYPIDRVPGPDGLFLGQPETKVLSDLGFASMPGGSPYLLTVPADPLENKQIIYRSLQLDGKDCDVPPCHTFELIFELEQETGGLPQGRVVFSPEISGAAARAVRGSLPVVSFSFGRAVTLGAVRTAEILAETARGVADNPNVETAATVIVAPAATAAVVANAVTLLPLARIPQFLIYFFSQPFLLLFRKRRRSYGIVYNGLSKIPVDLAIVRLRDLRTNAVVRSAVTDPHGRYQFLAPPGTYRLEVAKPGFDFPSDTLRGRKEDGQFIDLYFGDPIRVEVGEGLTKTIPLDPLGADLPDRTLLRSDLSRRLRHGVALSGVALTAGTAIAVPTPPVFILLGVHLAVYLIFRRLSEPVRARGWGTVYDEGSGKPVPHAVLRLFALPYHKLIASAVSDVHGRYHFLVGQAEVYLTVSKPGHIKTETDPIDLSAAAGPTVIANDIPLRRERPIQLADKEPSS